MRDNGPQYAALKITRTCRWYPSQWDVLALPRPLYVRFRFGTLTVQEDEGDTLGPDLLVMAHGDAMDGEMSTEVMQELTAGLIDWGRVS